jgi:hypothetical protein
MSWEWLIEIDMKSAGSGLFWRIVVAYLWTHVWLVNMRRPNRNSFCAAVVSTGIVTWLEYRGETGRVYFIWSGHAYDFVFVP